MSRSVVLTLAESEALEKLGRRLKLARLRRNLTQAGVAERAGATRKSIVALEAGQSSVGLGLLVKVLGVLGYPERIAELLENDPLGEDVAMVHGRKQARRKVNDDVADF
jgi:transcriptional regulator with XRE-family HTH domain